MSQPSPTPGASLTRFSGAKWTTLYTAGAAIALVAWILNVAQLYWMSGAMFLLPQLSRLFAYLEQSGLEVERVTPASANQGDVIAVQFRVENHLPLPKLHVFLSDELPRGLVPQDPMPLPIHVPPRGETTETYQLRVGRRGLHRLGEVRLVSTDMLGVSVRSASIPASAEIVAYPRVIPLPNALIPPRGASGRASEENAVRKGEGAGFYGIREYRPGDPLRHVHWRTAARLGRLTVVEWEAEEARDTALLVDTRAAIVHDMGEATSLDAAAGLAASLARALLERGETVRLIAPGTTPPGAPPVRGADGFREMLDALARMDAQSELSPSEALRRIMVTMAAGTRICWIAAALDEEYFAAVRLLQGAGFPVTTYALIPRAGNGDTPGGEPRAQYGPGGEAIYYLQPGDPIVTQLLA